jgi:hypothetical protein
MILFRTLIDCVVLLGLVYVSAKAQVSPTTRAEAGQAVREPEMMCQKRSLLLRR